MTVTNENILQLTLALVAIAPGVIALYVQWRKNRTEAADAARDDNREDFTALFEAAKQLGDAGTALVGPLTETIEKLRKEMADRQDKYNAGLRELEMRLTTAERQIEELIEANRTLADANERYENFISWIKGELGRLSRVEPGKFPKGEGIPEYLKDINK